ncbi:hypothetical protein F4779DRAFT_627530 [Xylariaceae sp. FL0662B]|nr:hypothetical protein F4779DRAFT_627530 [Xylariaceae sp. FL0662B]
MEPISILSVAAAALQFLDFGSRVLTDTREAYASSGGRSRNNLELSRISEDFARLARDIESKLQDHELMESGQRGNWDYKAKTRDLLFQFCRETGEINEQLQGLLTKLRAHGTTKLELAASSLFVALKGILTTEKIQNLKNRLDQTRQQIMTAMMAMSWCQAERTGVSMVELAEQQVKLMDQLGTIDETTRQLGNDIKELTQGRTQQHQFQAEALTHRTPIPESRHNGTARARSHTISNIINPRRNKELAEVIIQSLSFDSLNSRKQAIPKAHSDTYEWVFESPRLADNGEPLWSDFPKWLTGQSNHVPGAGKSTLFKFLTRDERLWSSLRAWANPSNLILATYFSWNAGNSFQKSCEGLLRTLLSQCLERRWAMLQLFDDKVSLPDWTMVELEAGFKALLSQAGRKLSDKGTSFKFGLFIDGLDEFEGDHLHLVELVREASTYPNVKICVSSRPWNVFRDVFSQNPMLQLELLTQNDIRLYVQGLFEKSQGFKERSLLQPDEANKVLEVLVIKAQGVFLWVSVVGDKLSDLQATLTTLPEDLSDLYHVIWKRTNSRYYGEAAQYFSIVEAYAKCHMPASSVAIWIGEEEPAFLRTRGLLETYQWADIPNGRVDYMHRTARDWVHEHWNSVCSLLEPQFDATLVLLKGETLRLRVDNFLTQRHPPEMFWSHLVKLLHVTHQLGKSRSTNDSLVHISDRLHKHVSELSSIKNHLGDPILSSDIHILARMSTFHSEPPGSPSRSNPHPGGTPVLLPDGTNDWTGWTHISFLGLMAQIPVVSYVEAKMTQDPKTEQAGGTTVPILVNAVVGGIPEDPLRYSIEGGREHASSRLSLVRFLLSRVSVDEVGMTLDFVRDRRRSADTTKDEWTLRYLADVEAILLPASRAHAAGKATRHASKTIIRPKDDVTTKKTSLVRRLWKIVGIKA